MSEMSENCREGFESTKSVSGKDFHRNSPRTHKTIDCRPTLLSVRRCDVSASRLLRLHAPYI